MNTLLDIDKARRCTASAVRYKNLREGYSGMQNKKNLLIYAHYYIPDTASTGQILRELAEGMLDKFNIMVICVVPSYLGTIEDKYKTQKYYKEEINGVKMLRIRVPEFSKTNKKSRVKNIVSYFFGAIGATYFDMVGCKKWKIGCHDCEQKKSYPSSLIKDNSHWNWEKKRSLFTNLNITLVTPCKWLKNIVRQSFLKEYSVEVIYNGIDLSIFHPETTDFEEKYNLQGKYVILGVASEWTNRKGLKDFIKLEEMLDKTKYRIVLVGLTEKQIEELPDTIIGIKRTQNIQELVGIYTRANVFFNPTYKYLIYYGANEKKIYRYPFTSLKNSDLIWMICIVIYFPLWGSLARFILLGTYVVFAAFKLRKSKYKSLLFGGFFLGFCLMFSETRHMTSFRDIILNRKSILDMMSV